MRQPHALRYRPHARFGRLRMASFLKPGRLRPRFGHALERDARSAPDSTNGGRATERVRLRPASLVEAAIFLMTGAALVFLLVAGVVGQMRSHHPGAPTAYGARRLSSGSRLAPDSRWEGLPPGGAWAPTGLTVATNALLNDPYRAATIFAGTGDGLWLSPDDGVTWRRDGNGLDGAAVLALSATPSTGTIIAGADNGAVYASTARRGSDRRWSRISPRLGPDHPIFSVSFSPRAGQTVLAGTFGALYRGSHSGGRWAWQQVVRTEDAAITSIVWAPWAAHLAFASVFAGSPSVLVSYDDGRTWHPDTEGLPPTLPTSTLRAFVDRAPRVILSTMGGGVWLRSTAGTWRDISAGLPAHHAMDFIVVPGTRGAVLYAGTMGFGVYVKQETRPWRRLSRGLNDVSHTILSLAMTSGPRPWLLAATARGVFRYVPPR